MHAKDTIEIDDPNSWNENLRTILTDNIGILSRFAGRELEINLLPSTDIWTSINEFEDERNEVISLIDNVIQDCSLIGYHCTRLTENEVQEIRANGLQLLSKDFITQRIERLLKEKEIEIATHLISKNECNNKNRRDRIWFVCGQSVLKYSSGVIRLFSSWGGEALYISHEGDRNSGPVLKTIGRPYIIKVNLIPSELDLFINLSHKVEESFLISNGIPTSNTPQFDVCSKKPISSVQILEAISKDESKFQELTNYKNWAEKL